MQFIRTKVKLLAVVRYFVMYANAVYTGKGKVTCSSQIHCEVHNPVYTGKGKVTGSSQIHCYVR